MTISKKQREQLKCIALTGIPSFEFIKLKQDLCQKVCTLKNFVTRKRYDYNKCIWFSQKIAYFILKYRRNRQNCEICELFLNS